MASGESADRCSSDPRFALRAKDRTPWTSTGSRWLVPVLAVGVVVACGGPRRETATWRQVTAPNGGPAAWITCTRQQGYCFELAGKLCPYGYSVLRDDGTFVGESGQADLRRNSVEIDTRKKYEGHLFVQCLSERRVNDTAVMTRSTSM